MMVVRFHTRQNPDGKRWDVAACNADGSTAFVATCDTADEANARAEALQALVPNSADESDPADWLRENRQVWLGTSVEDQERADERIPHLLQCPAAVRFLSAEPLLGDLDITPWMPRGIDWVITGIESRGKQAGRFVDGYEAAARHIMQQCERAGVACFNKQMAIRGVFSHDPYERGASFPDFHSAFAAAVEACKRLEEPCSD